MHMYLQFSRLGILVSLVIHTFVCLGYGWVVIFSFCFLKASVLCIHMYSY